MSLNKPNASAALLDPRIVAVACKSNYLIRQLLSGQKLLEQGQGKEH